MKNTNLINSFYKDYKKIHDILSNHIINDDGRVSRIIDRIIVYIFILNNLLEESIREEFNNRVDEEGYSAILNLYLNSDKLSLNNNINQLTKLFKVDNFEKKINIPKDLISRVLKILNKYEWNIEEEINDRAITPDILGNVFEKYINQREMGAYYTEEDTINYINYNTIIYYILDRLSGDSSILQFINELHYEDENIKSIEDLIVNNYNLFDILVEFIDSRENIEDLNKLDKYLKDITIADISCGTGAFLVETIDLLIRINEKLNVKIKELSGKDSFSRLDTLISIIENNIYGVDIMDDAIVIAKFRLCLKVLVESIKSKSKIQNDIKFNLKVGNTLYGDIGLDKNEIEQLVAVTIDEDNFKYKFNWKEEFPEIIKRGGFDCIVGNPPYVEYSKMVKNYQIYNYETIKCGNTYAFMSERAINLLGKNGKVGLIVPISIVSTKRMTILRDLIERECSDIFYSNYGDRPDALFNGVHQKVTILLAKKQKNNISNIYSSRYIHWYKEERNKVFKNIRYIKNTFKNEDTIFKIGEEIDISIINKINSVETPISKLFNNDGLYSSYLSTRLTFWVKCFNNEKLSNEFKKYNFNTKEEALLFTAIMNSSLYYYFWEVVSDEWHITNKELELFKFNFNLMEKEYVNELCKLSLDLERDLENKKVYIGSKQTEYEYRHKNSKLIIDKIDLILKKYYRLTDKEYRFILDYNLKYRMNDEYENYINNRPKII